MRFEFFLALPHPSVSGGALGLSFCCRLRPLGVSESDQPNRPVLGDSSSPRCPTYPEYRKNSPPHSAVLTGLQSTIHQIPHSHRQCLHKCFLLPGDTRLPFKDKASLMCLLSWKFLCLSHPGSVERWRRQFSSPTHHSLASCNGFQLLQNPVLRGTWAAPWVSDFGFGSSGEIETQDSVCAQLESFSVCPPTPAHVHAGAHLPSRSLKESLPKKPNSNVTHPSRHYCVSFTF